MGLFFAISQTKVVFLNYKYKHLVLIEVGLVIQNVKKLWTDWSMEHWPGPENGGLRPRVFRYSGPGLLLSSPGQW